MEKELTEKDYENYMRNVNDYIERAKIIIDELPTFVAISRLSYEDWVRFQHGKYEMKNSQL